MQAIKAGAGVEGLMKQVGSFFFFFFFNFWPYPAAWPPR